MASEVPDSIKNFPKCLEEALEFAVEDTSPPFKTKLVDWAVLTYLIVHPPQLQSRRNQ